jgi:hypothetical protein
VEGEEGEQDWTFCRPDFPAPQDKFFGGSVLRPRRRRVASHRWSRDAYERGGELAGVATVVGFVLSLGGT